MPPKISIMPIKPRGMLCNTLFAEQGLSEHIENKGFPVLLCSSKHF